MLDTKEEKRLARPPIATRAAFANATASQGAPRDLQNQIGARGFEPPTSWSQTTRSTKLSYAPNRAESLPRFISSCIYRWIQASPCHNSLAQIRREPFFHCGYGFVSPGRVINCLIASNLSDAEIFRFRMRKIEPAHAGAGMHGK